MNKHYYNFFIFRSIKINSRINTDVKPEISRVFQCTFIIKTIMMAEENDFNIADTKIKYDAELESETNNGTRKSNNNKIPIKIPISIPIIMEMDETLTVKYDPEVYFFVTLINIKAKFKTPKYSNFTITKKYIDKIKIENKIKKYKPGPKSKTKDEDYERTESVINKFMPNSTTNEIDVDAKISPVYITTRYQTFCPALSPKHIRLLSQNILPYAPILKLHNVHGRLVLVWDMNKFLKPQIPRLKIYELYMSRVPKGECLNVLTWKKVCDFKANVIPIGCIIESLPKGFTYHFSLRAIDIYNVPTPFRIQHTHL